VEVATVDGFQGREKEALVISAVRVGFVADRRRMNVAVTRARRQCVLVADSDTLSRNPFLRGLVDHFHSHGLCRSAAEVLD
jgi:ATP-dependent RNA/DNA helicase IGHMBP2